MAYIGRNPAIGTQKVLDSLESQFNGSLTTFDLRYETNTIYPTLASSLIVSLGGVLQEPGTAYTVASDQITFASAPTAGTDCWILLYSEFGGVAGATSNLTVSNNLTVQGDINIDGGQITYTASSNIAKFADDVKLVLGTDDDLEIYHDGGTGYIDNNLGQLRVSSASSMLFFHQSGAGTEDYAKFLHNGAVELYHDGTKAFETTSNGVDIPLGTITGPATLNIDPAAVGDNTGTVVIKGDLQVDGTTTTINSTTLTVDDKNILLASGANNNAAADGAGITVDTANATLLYKATPDAWTFNKKVGIGTDSPAYLAHIHNSGTGAGDHAYLHFTTGDTGSGGSDGLTVGVGANGTAYINYREAGPLSLGTSGTEKVRIASNGNVGINSVSPTKKLDVQGNAVFGPNATRLHTYSDSGYSGIYNGTGLISDESFYMGAGTLFFYTDGSEAFRVDSSGRVLIGTTVEGHTSAQELTVAGAGHSGITIRSGASYIGSLFFSDATSSPGEYSGFLKYSHLDDFLAIGVDRLERLRILDNGNVGIGEDSPDVRLHVKETIDSAYSLANVTTDANHLLKLENPSTTANAFSGMQFRVGGGADLFFGAIQQSVNHGDFFFANQNSPQKEMMRIKSTGSVGIGTDDPGTKLHIEGTGNESITLRLKQGTTPGNSSSLQVGRTDGAGNQHITDAVTGGIPISGIPGILLGSSNTSVPAVSIRSANSANGHIVFSPKGTEKVRITSDGVVNIGGDYTQTAYKTQITGDLLIQKNQAAYQHPQIELYNYSTGAYGGAIKFTGNLSGTKYTQATIRTYGGSSTTDGSLAFFTGDGTEKLRITSTGSVNIGGDYAQSTYKLKVTGSFAATTKSFVIDHPTKEGMKLRHGSLEGPENGVYVRGRSCLEVINLPEYWTALVDPDSITVTLTPIGPSGHPRVERIENNKVYVFSEDSRPLDYFYMINAERVDVEPLEVEIPE